MEPATKAALRAARLESYRDIRTMQRSMLRSFYIYFLLEPDRDVIRYVGICTCPTSRYGAHCRCSKAKTPCERWIRRLRDRGLVPRMQIAAVVMKPTMAVTGKMAGAHVNDAAHEVERLYIRQLSRRGKSNSGIPARLLNIRDIETKKFS